MVCVLGCAGAGLALWRGWARWTTISFVVVVAGMGVVTAGALAVRLEARSGHPLWQADGKARIVGIIRDDAVSVGPAAASMVRVRVDVTGVAGRSTVPMGAELTGAAADWSELLPGQRFSVLVRVRPPRDGDLLVARLSASGARHTLGRPPPHQRLAGAVRARLQLISARALGPEAAGLFPGLVLGDTSSLDTRVRDDFRAAGLSHLLAVSGSNFAIVTGAVVMLVRALGTSPRVTAVVGILIVVVFVILVRPSPSVLRAAMMGTVGLLALAGSRRVHALPALGAATVVGLLWWPDLAVAPGFALSVLATAGLVLWSASLRDWLRARRIPAGVAELLAMSLAAQLVTAPIIALLSGRFSVVALLANVLVVPVVGLVGIVGTAAAVIGSVGGADGPGAGCAELMVRALGPELWWMLTCARFLGAQTWATVSVPSGVVGALVVGAVTLIVVVAVGAGTRYFPEGVRGLGRAVGSVWHDGRRG
ncbi:ComEC/Rec2 family competence protein [Gordonia sp. OPL2]|nr:ComEC/Rec2 family competence protein [Gordonia sp. OPL2]